MANGSSEIRLLTTASHLIRLLASEYRSLTTEYSQQFSQVSSEDVGASLAGLLSDVDRAA